MKLHCVFLRDSCILPGHLDPLRKQLGNNWSWVVEIGAPAFGTMIRSAGWALIREDRSCSRRGFGLTQESATLQAVARALWKVSRQCNAATLDFAYATKYPGFLVALVTIQPLDIQQDISPAVRGGVGCFV